MPKMLFVNLPVGNLAASTRFYEALGCRKNQQFSSDQASSMVWSDQITFQLLAREYFSTFTSKQIPDAHSTCQVMLCLSCESRDEVDSLSAAAASTGGKAGIREPIDLGFLYNRAVEDPDGHVIELAWMSPHGM
jgi:Predicted lactoylglutathione lyase|nr:VOC family protein [uncultured Steroidobacter sp.]